MTFSKSTVIFFERNQKMDLSKLDFYSNLLITK